MLNVPPHVSRANVAVPNLRFAWDEWRVKNYYWNISQSLFDRLDALSDTACMGLAIASGEWVVHRFDGHNADPAPLQFLEAAWAALVHPAYCIYTETVDDEWRGPVRGPLAVTIAIVNDGIFCRSEDPEVATRACWMHRLATHVLDNSAPFSAWFDHCIQTMEIHHRKRLPMETGLFGSRFWDGEPIPREAFDPTFPYTPGKAAPLLDGYLRSVDPTSNPYLRSPGELLTIEEFEGSPYQYMS